MIPGQREGLRPAFVARLDPRTVALLPVLLLPATFAASRTEGMVLLGAALGLLLPLLATGEGRRAVALLVGLPLVLGSALGLLFTTDPDPWWTLPGGIGPGAHAAAEGFRGGLRAANLGGQALLVATTLSATTTAEAWSALLAPLARVFGPRVHTALLQLQITFRMGPLLAHEATRVRLSQELRGLRARGSLAARARSVRPLFVPVLAATLLRADRLAMLLVARGYRPGTPRPYLPGARFRLADGAVVAGAVLLGAWVVIR